MQITMDLFIVLVYLFLSDNRAYRTMCFTLILILYRASLKSRIFFYRITHENKVVFYNKYYTLDTRRRECY